QVQPVLDVAGHRPVGSYEIPDHLRAQVHYRDVECAFPHCHAPARSCDLDHVVPYPEGPTCACNLVPLCRRHHRAKTARRWSYVMVHPGCYYWHSPAGGHYLVDSHGTHALPDLSDVGAAARFRRPCVADISARIHAPQQPALPRDGRPRAPTHRARPETTSPAESATRGPTMSGPHSPPPLPEEPPPF
ncbi:MAG TPA: HNH endonuclease signature motif containing protein, partial [Ruania sp.]|nr:HNH endonuclease signature motif containing protein [Ruania sp.]